MSPRSLSVIAFLVLQGCCGSDPEYFDEVVHEDHDGVVEGALLGEIVETNPTEEARCEAACHAIVGADDGEGGEVVDCAASAFAGGDPWDPSNTSVAISCTTERSERVARPPTCCRRPHGLHPTDDAMRNAGEWFARVAHLEAASVVAFEQLASALVLHGAPASLVARCLEAADDERGHARVIAALAHRGGARVAEVSTDAAPTGLLEVALHNAIEGEVHEAFAAILAAHQARHAPADLRATFARIGDDECTHGQLSWDVHAWLVGRLGAADRARVELAWREALARLPAIAAEQARATPVGLGWPSPTRAAQMAEAFARLVAERRAA